MKAKVIAQDANMRTFVLVLDPGEEAFKTLSGFINREKVTAASLTAIGAFERAIVGWFDLANKAYRRIPVSEQCEVLSAVGDVAIADDGKSSLHLHVVLGLADGSTRGGHLLEGYIQPTLEVTLTETPAHLHRRKRPELGLALIELADR